MSQLATSRQVAQVVRPQLAHWVGDGFYVHQLIPGPNGLSHQVDPFLLLDYNPPRYVAASDRPGGVGVHPHRGFETVTIALEGVVAHHDSTGAGGVIRPGDVQWMTAASGILHKEYHEAEWAAQGGTFHMVQLWVNLPAKHKMDPPRYQGITADQMPVHELTAAGSRAVLIAGSLGGLTGPAVTHTPINLWRVFIEPGDHVALPVPSTHQASALVVNGAVDVGAAEGAGQGSLLVLGDGELVDLRAHGHGAEVLVMTGEPIGEPVVSHGPFVMNTEAEIRQAYADFRAGAFGHLD